MKTFAEVKQVVGDFVVSLGRESSYTLERVEALLDKLDNPQEKFKTVHVAGTSGKSSTAYYTASILQAAGYKTGLSISPYLEELNERVQIGTTPVPEKVFCENFTEFFEIVKDSDIRPTYFELFVSFAYWYFAKIKLDYAVIEVGLGGLLDATNVIRRPDKVCVITDIGLDHIKILGDTVGEIAAQKAGIIQQHNNLFMYRQGAEVTAAIEKRAKQKHAVIHYAQEVSVIKELPKFQQRNWNLAANTCKFILTREGHDSDIDRLVKASRIIIPGRLEEIRLKDKMIILDGAHNPQKMQSMVESFKAKFPGIRPAMLFAVGGNKSAHMQDISREVNKLNADIIITTFKKEADENSASIEPKTIAQYLDGDDTVLQPDLDKALDDLLSRNQNILLVSGSLYLVGAVRKKLKNTQLAQQAGNSR